nr:zinc finger BED domain-containing protein RICESLEEPER 2-like [Ipomoea batatas]
MGAVTSSSEPKKKIKSNSSIEKGVSKPIMKGASTSKAPESSKDHTEEKKKRKAPEKRKETSHAHTNDDDAPPVNLEVIMSSSRLPLLTPEKDVATAALTTYVLPQPLVRIDEESSDEDDALPLTRSLSRKQKTKEPKPSEPKPSGPRGRQPSIVAESISQKTRADSPMPQTRDIPAKSYTVEVEVAQKEYTSSTLPQEPVHVEEVEDVIEAEGTANVQPHDEDGRPRVGTSRGHANLEDEEDEDKQPKKDSSGCDDNVRPHANNDDEEESSNQSTHPPSNTSKEEESDDSSDSSSSSDSDDDNNDNQGMSVGNSSIPQNPYTLNSVFGESNETVNEVNEQAEGLERVGLHSDGHDPPQNEVAENQEFQTNKRKKLQVVDNQTKLIFLPSDGVSSSIHPLHHGRVDMEVVRESISNWIMMHEHPFTIVKEAGFNIVMKRVMP